MYQKGLREPLRPSLIARDFPARNNCTIRYSLWYTTDMKTVALYARVSTKDRQEVKNQLVELRRYARRQRWKVVEEYVDRESGAKADRPKFKKLFLDAHQGKFDLLLFWDLSRLSREGALRTLQHLQRLTDYGVQWRSHTQPYLDSMGPFGDAIVSLLAALAQQERETIRARVKAGMDRAKKEGKHVGRPKKIFDRGKARRLREAGGSYRAIASQLGVSTMTARRACQ